MSAPSNRLSDLTHEQLDELVASLGERPFRARQIREWMFRRGELDVAAMKNLPAAFRERLKAALIPPAEVVTTSRSEDETEKLLFSLHDDRLVEAVIIPAPKRTTVCISSQVGCAVRCRFCASGMDGGKRNLTRGEIVEQFLAAQRRARESDREITNLVMMGMGEPMFNHRNVLSALAVINAPDGAGLGARRITVSTIGIRPGVAEFTAARTQYTLAFSLHAPNDRLRREIVPLEAAMSVAEIRDAAMKYLRTTGREVTFEYVLLKDVNDGESEARELVALLRGVQGTVNLIPYNPVPGLPYERPSVATVDRFEEILRGGHVKVSVRRRKGADIDAACGQLALRHKA